MNKQASFFDKCLRLKKIRLFSRGRLLAPKEINLAKTDLERSKSTFRDGDYKWATVQAYYSMFHSAKALLFKKNYREKSHACLVEAIRVFYVQEKKLGYWFVEALQKGKTLREEADYYGAYTKLGAKDLLQKAEEFLNVAEKIIKNKK